MRLPKAKTHVNANNGVRVQAPHLFNKNRHTTYSICREDLAELDELTSGCRKTLYQIMRHIATTIKLKDPIPRRFGGMSGLLVRRTKRYLKDHPEINESVAEVQKITNEYWDTILKNETIPAEFQ